MLGVQKFLQFISNNWLIIVIVIAIIVLAARIAYEFFTKSQNEQVSIVKQQIAQVILKLVTEAELDYADWVGAGAVKRAQVIDAIFTAYPILSIITDQDSVIAWLDNLIDNALGTLNDILEENVETSEEDTNESEINLDWGDIATATVNGEDITFSVIHADNTTE